MVRKTSLGEDSGVSWKVGEACGSRRQNRHQGGHIGGQSSQVSARKSRPSGTKAFKVTGRTGAYDGLSERQATAGFLLVFSLTVLKLKF